MSPDLIALIVGAELGAVVYLIGSVIAYRWRRRL